MEEVLTLTAQEWSERARELAGEGWLLSSLCGVDRLGIGPTPHGSRFEVVAQLIHHGSRQRLMVRVSAEGDPPVVPSVTGVWPGANFMEREAYDMFGIRFEGHPDLSRILMPDEWEGHPLRKDYGVGKVPVEFVPQPFLQVDSPGQSPRFDEAGRPVDELGQAGQENLPSHPKARSFGGARGASAAPPQSQVEPAHGKEPGPGSGGETPGSHPSGKPQENER